MIRPNRKFFEIWGDMEAQNGLLKVLLLLFTSLLALATVSLTVLGLRKSPLYLISDHLTSEVQAQTESAPTRELEVKHAMSRFVGLRMNWEPTKIDMWKTQVMELIAKETRPKFSQSQAQVIAAIKAKQMSQRFYLTSLKLLTDEKSAVAEGSRLIEVDGVRAVLPAILRMQYSYGDRTAANPEGVYVVSEEFQATETATGGN